MQKTTWVRPSSILVSKKGQLIISLALNLEETVLFKINREYLRVLLKAMDAKAAI